MSDKCKRCKAPIFFARTEAGKMNPINAEPDREGNIVIRNGYASGIGPVFEMRVLSKERVAENRKAVIREVTYKSHYATCAFASEFRKGV